MRTNRIHALKEDRGTKFDSRRTYCGLVGWPEDGAEYSTVDGNRFEAVLEVGRVTCGKCLKSIRSSGTKKAPPGRG